MLLIHFSEWVHEKEGRKKGRKGGRKEVRAKRKEGGRESTFFL